MNVFDLLVVPTPTVSIPKEVTNAHVNKVSKCSS